MKSSSKTIVFDVLIHKGGFTNIGKKENHKEKEKGGEKTARSGRARKKKKKKIHHTN